MTEPKTFTPIVLDFGKKSTSKINKLKRGEGELMQEIEFTYNNIKERLTEGKEDKEIIPVIIIYEEKQKAKTMFPFPFS